MNENEIPPLSESKNVTLRDNSINTNQTTYNTQINKNSITPYLVTYLLHQQGPGGAPALLYYSFIKPIPFVSRDQAREDGFGRKGISVSTNQYGYYLSDKSKSANIGKDFFILFPAAQSKKQTPQHTRYVFQRRRWYDTSYFTPLNFLVYYTYKWEIIYKTGNEKGKCPQNIEIILKKYAIKHNVPLDLFKGMCYIESAFNPKSGATGPYKGLFQLGKPVWDEYYKFKIDWSKNALDPDLNADCGGELTSDNMITASKLIQKYVK